MTKPPRKMGRPPTGEPRKVQVFSFLPPEDAAWFMSLPPKERGAWLAAKVAQDRADSTRSASDSEPNSND